MNLKIFMSVSKKRLESSDIVMSKGWWELKQTLIIQYSIARMTGDIETSNLLSKYLMKMDSKDKTHTFLDYVTTLQPFRGYLM